MVSKITDTNIDKEISVNSEVLSLLAIYLDEFKHRNELLWSQVYKLFYATLILTLLPNITGLFSIQLPAILEIFYRVIGVIMSIIFLFISLSYAKRLEASSSTYNQTIDLLPAAYRRKKVNELKYGKIFKSRTSYLLIFMLFVALLLIQILLLVFI